MTEIIRNDRYGRGVEAVDIYGDPLIKTFDVYGRVISVTENIGSLPVITKAFAYRQDGELFIAEAKYMDQAGMDKYIRMQFIKDGLGHQIQSKKESIA